MDDFLTSTGSTPAPTIAPDRRRAGNDLVVSSDIRRVVATLGTLFTRHLARSPGPLLVGVGGGPGAGKTTFSLALADELAANLPTSRILQLSLEDFYYSKTERLARGHRWRAVPGTHDLESIMRVIRTLRTQRSGETAVPRFDMATGEARPAEPVILPVSICILEGWLVGYGEGGYGELSDLIDFLVFLDGDIPLLRKSRFHREQVIRVRSRGRAGMSAEQLAAFWREALEPGIARWVTPVRTKSDLIIEVGEDHNVLSVSAATSRGAVPVGE